MEKVSIPFTNQNQFPHRPSQRSQRRKKRNVYTHLKSLIGLPNQLSDGFSWTLLKCIPHDQNSHLVQLLRPFIAECNSKLAVALTIMEESFLPMVDPKTGTDMIPQVIYNWGSQPGRLNYRGFYTVVLEDDDIMVSVATIRIHGTKVVELPSIATCSKSCRMGMCRRLMNCIEKVYRKGTGRGNRGESGKKEERGNGKERKKGKEYKEGTGRGESRGIGNKRRKGKRERKKERKKGREYKEGMGGNRKQGGEEN
ncbi:unnamed protein product [Cuscuta epithymum]|uniref:Increased DNA methylation 1 C-terminal domain-containing protein n=1 Tax=Cuscuta epithymum TaxID=186058 RepID=A0AAV0C4B1_9ASTE|nr:unnamed protein product [Cuscuta epithymum]CAH9066712.1 unnamed protein product [Cuscuta epithymum]CAH9066726.1 unnamed protein product [Cuscuta epithymum]CAH9066750.1 unnamed protein product [Cuscuta epithymum]CAH9066765.1 unnamed protein product [Cuscuta epithymum]